MEEQLGAGDPHLFEARNLLGENLMRQSKFADANGQFDRVLDAPAGVLPLDHPARETALSNLAYRCAAQGIPRARRMS